MVFLFSALQYDHRLVISPCNSAESRDSTGIFRERAMCFLTHAISFQVAADAFKRLRTTAHLRIAP